MDTTDNETSTQAAEVAAEPARAPAPAPVEDVKLSVETWAEKKGLLPALLPPPQFRAPRSAGAGGIAAIAMSGLTGPRPNPKHYLYAQARIGEHHTGGHRRRRGKKARRRVDPAHDRPGRVGGDRRDVPGLFSQIR